MPCGKEVFGVSAEIELGRFVQVECSEDFAFDAAPLEHGERDRLVHPERRVLRGGIILKMLHHCTYDIAIGCEFRTPDHPQKQYASINGVSAHHVLGIGAAS
ncbi:hypothetical protein D9M68_947790 [compost metagenome]